MLSPLLILTGASGAGKTTISRAISRDQPRVLVLEADALEPPSAEFVETIGPTEGPGGSFQRSRALFWVGQLKSGLLADRPVLLDYQCRIAFLEEALRFHAVTTARIILVECNRQERETRLHERGSPGLVHDEMHNWSQYLHKEAEEAGIIILNTFDVPVAENVRLLVRFLLNEHA